MPNSQELLQYFNIGIICIITLFAIIGFIRGTRKSIFYFIATLIIFGLGWLLMKPASSFLMDFNLSSFGFNIEGVEITSLNDSISELIKTLYPEASTLMEEDTTVKGLVYSLSTMVIKLVYFIVLIVLAFTIFKVLTDIFWLVFKPKKKKGFIKKGKSIGNRMIGFGIGGFKGLFYTLLICFPLAGIASIASSLSTITEDPSEDLSYNLVFVNNQVSLVETSEESEMGELDQILDLLGLYEKSIAGKVFGTTKVDKFLFDGIFSFEINNKSVKLRKELEIVSKALSKSKALSNGNFDINILLEEDPEVLKSIIDDLSSLELVKVAVPVAIEVALYLEDKEGNKIVDFPEEIKNDIDLKELAKLDFASDVKKLGYAFVDFTTIYSFNSDEEIDYLGFDPEIVKSIINNVSETQIVDEFAPMAISYITTLSTINSSLSKLGLTIDDLKLDEVDNWIEEIGSFGIIYEKLFDLQIKSFDENETFEYVTEEKVNALSTAIFESSILKNAAPVLIESISKDLVEVEYIDNLIFDDIVWDENEFSSVVNAAVSIFKSGLTSDDPDALKNISDDTINDLAKYLSKSKFVTTNLNVIIESVVKKTEYFSEDVTIVKLTQAEWTEDELLSLFKTTKLLVESGSENILKMDDNNVRNLSSNLSKSKFITRNIDTIIDVAFKNVDLEGVTLGEFEHWSDPEKAENEFYYIIKSAQIIESKGSDLNAFLDLTNQDLDTLLNSKLISETLVNVLKEYSKDGNSLELLDGVENPDIDWYDEVISNTSFTIEENILKITKVEGANKYYVYKDNEKIGSTKTLEYEIIDLESNYEVVAVVEGELRKMFVAISAVVDSITANEPFTTDMITSLTDEEIDNIMESDILVLSLIKQLEDMSKETDSFIVIPDGNLKSADESIKLNAWKDKEVDGKIVQGELSKAFRGLRLFLSDVDIDNFTTASITNLNDSDIYEILKSDILAESIIVQIEKLADEGSVFVIPNDVGLGKLDSRDAWKNIYEYNQEGELISTQDGELTKLLRSIRVINTQGDIENIDVNNILEETNREIVLASLIVEETIINKVISVSEDNPDITIPDKYKLDRAYWKQSTEGEGELRRLLNSLSFIMGENDSINDFTFDLGLVIVEKDEILKSDIIVESIISKLNNQAEINIPTSSEFGLLNIEDRSAWKNDYDLDESNNYIYVDGKVKVLRHGELSKLLHAVDIVVEADPVTNEKNFEKISFDINAAFGENQTDILDSLVISETIVQKIFDEADKNESQLKIPSANYVNQREDDSRNLWFNEYQNGDLVKGELAYLLDAVAILIGNEGKIADLDIDFKTLFDNENQKNILKSKVISESIVYIIFNESKSESKPNSIIEIPNKGYVETLADENRTKWFNTYNDLGDVDTFGEISYLIEAIEALFGNDFSFETLNFELNTIFDVKDTVLKSTIISEIIVRKIFEVGKLYNEIETDDEGIIIPSDLYLEAINDPRDENRTNWFNSVDENGDVIDGEISYLLHALELLGLSESKFNELSFNLNALFNDDIQKDILQSKIISETIVHKINKVAESGNLNLPSETYLEKIDNPNRDKWFNDYSFENVIKGEISYLLKAVELIVGETGSFETIEFDISELFDDSKQVEILKSTVISETIISKIISNEDSIPSDTLPTVDLEGRPLNNADNRDAWYNDYSNGIKENELAKFLDSLALILGTDNSFELMGAITIDEILNLEFNVIMNTDKEVVSSDFDILLDSIIMEYIISPLVIEIAQSTDMLGNYLIITNDNYFKKEDVIANFGAFDEKLYDTKSFLDSLYLLNNAGFHYSEIKDRKLEDFEVEKFDDIGNSMVASRIFKASIAKMFNAFGESYYNDLPNSIPFTSYVKKNWDDVKFYQSDYDNTTPLEAHTLFKAKLTSWTDPMTFYELII